MQLFGIIVAASLLIVFVVFDNLPAFCRFFEKKPKESAQPNNAGKTRKS